MGYDVSKRQATGPYQFNQVHVGNSYYCFLVLAKYARWPVKSAKCICCVTDAAIQCGRFAFAGDDDTCSCWFERLEPTASLYAAYWEFGIPSRPHPTHSFWDQDA